MSSRKYVVGLLNVFLLIHSASTSAFDLGASGNVLNELAGAASAQNTSRHQDGASAREDKSSVAKMSNSTGKVVVVSGAGESVQLAKEDAIRQAVESVVSSYVSSDLMVKNEAEIQDKVINYSAGFIEEMDVLNQGRRQDGLFEVKIRAVVTTQKVRRKLEEQNIQTRELESESMFGEAVSQLNSINSASELWGALLKKYPSAALSASVAGKPVIGAEEPGEMVRVDVPFRVDWDKEFQSEFMSILDASIAGKKYHAEESSYCIGVLVDHTCFQIPDAGLLRTIAVQMYKNIVPFRVVLRIKDANGKVRQTLQSSSCMGDSNISRFYERYGTNTEPTYETANDGMLPGWDGPFALGEMRPMLSFDESSQTNVTVYGMYRFFFSENPKIIYNNSDYLKFLPGGGIEGVLITRVKKADLLEFKKVEASVERCN